MYCAWLNANAYVLLLNMPKKGERSQNGRIPQIGKKVGLNRFSIVFAPRPFRMKLYSITHAYSMMGYDLI